MKCQKCGTELVDGVLFCRKCGNKVDLSQKRFCRECGSIIEEGSTFCSSCGSKIDLSEDYFADTISSSSDKSYESIKDSNKRIDSTASPQSSDTGYGYGDVSNKDTRKELTGIFTKKNLILACIVLLLLAAFLFRNSNNTPGSEVVETTQAPELVTVKVTVDFVSNLIFSRYDVDFLVNGKVLKTLSHGTDATFNFQTEKGTQNVTFAKHKDASVKGVDSFVATGDTEIAYKIACYNDKITAEVLPMNPSGDDSAKQTTGTPTELQKTEAVTTEATTVPPTTVAFTTEAFTDPPTTEISTDPPTTEAPTDPPTTEAPTTQAPTEPTTAKKSWPSHSSGDRKTAKKGNSGVYAYVKSGQNYDIYYIIDFEQGYVYYFLYGPNDKYSADRVKIVQGDLNSLVLITYHDGGSEWSYGLCFKWANQPDILIVQDEYGSKDQFQPMDLEEALEIRDSLSIIDY